MSGLADIDADFKRAQRPMQVRRALASLNTLHRWAQQAADVKGSEVISEAMNQHYAGVRIALIELEQAVARQ